jgi:pyruvate,orthophosphate dikinase
LGEFKDMEQWVYFFGAGKAEGRELGKMILGGKGANLVEMAHMGIPVPPGFVITCNACNYFSKNNEYPEGMVDQVKEKLVELEKATNMKFGDPERPLLVSVRSGAPISMPGMMDTVLNLGLNSKTIPGLAKLTNNERFAMDSFRRLLNMFGNVVLGIGHEHFEEVLEKNKEKAGVKYDTELNAAQLKEICEGYKKVIKEKTGQDFPEDPLKQLQMGIEAVFKSWNIERAVIYRKLNHIPDNLGTAVNVQFMVFGNMGEDSATGVAFTRNPADGDNKFYGEYLLNAQGEDVVAGIRTPHPIQHLGDDMPKIYDELMDIQNKLEVHFKEMQDLEFTVQQKKLYMLQTRTGKRTGIAALRIAVEMVEEGLIDEKTALMRVEPETIPGLLAPIFDPAEKKKVIAEGRFLAKGLNAGPGAAAAAVVFSSKKAAECGKSKKKCLLVRKETSPEDIGGMEAAVGVLTAVGGMTSHAAIVARGMNKPCVVGCSALRVEESKGQMIVTLENGKEKVIKEGDEISIDGGTGEVIAGSLTTMPSEIHQAMSGELKGKSQLAEYFQKFMSWADKTRKLNVRTNADTPRDSSNARMFGAEGIGLCRTEHMFFGGDRIWAMREMIIAEKPEDREKALEKLLPYQRDDFIGIFEVMDGLPVTIRLLDPPLHEFLPHTKEQMEELAKRAKVTVEYVENRAHSLEEMNPMLGHRGCRLGITFPEITRMQARAIIEAAIEVKKKGKTVLPEIMVPLVGHVKELSLQKDIIMDVAEKVMKEKGEKIDFMVGTMIEVPRAAVTADQVAEVAEFFSFGTNDLTQMTCGFSRDDAHKFLGPYDELGVYERNPFESLDQTGVGDLVRIACEKGRSINSKLKLGICGEHGGDPTSIHFFRKVNLNYVSCSPFRVPVARLAAAQAELAQQK